MARSRPTADLLDVVRRTRYATDTIAVGFSCGKDAAALLDLCSIWFKRVAAFYMFRSSVLSFHLKYLSFWEHRLGKKLIGGKILCIPHWDMSNLLSASVLRDWNTSFFNLPKTRIRDVEIEVMKRTGVEWVALGIRKQDSMERRAMLSACNDIDVKAKRSYPLSEWSDRTVTQYLRSRNIPLSPEYPIFGTSYNGNLQGDRLEKLREHYPGDYAKIVEKFPFAEAELARHLMRKQGGEAKEAKKQA